MLASMRNFQQRRHFRVIIRGALVNIYIYLKPSTPISLTSIKIGQYTVYYKILRLIYAHQHP